MALINCPNCKEQVSDKAIRCPHCHYVISDEKETSFQGTKNEKPASQLKKERVNGKKSVLIMCVLIMLIALILMIVTGRDTENDRVEDNNISEQQENVKLPTVVEYDFIDYTQFSEYWFDGIFRCGTDFEAGDYYILSIFGTGALFDVCDSPDDFSWTYHRMLRRISVKEGEYVNVAHGGIMVRAEEIDTQTLSKYGVFLVGEDLLAGDYKIETISTEYNTNLYVIQGIRGAYQINEQSIDSTPLDCNQLFDESVYLTLEEGQYIAISNAKLTNVSVSQSVSEKFENNEMEFLEDAKPIDGKEYQHDNFVYMIYDDDSIEITKYIGQEDEVDIYSEFNGYAVSRIGKSAFENCTSIEEVQLWADVISIGESAFKGCTSLKEISIPRSITNINDSTFEDCVSLKEVSIWGDVVNIGQNAFKNCISLKAISIPSSCILIEESAFEGCKNMEKVDFWGGNVIEASAFKGCSSLKEISIPSEVAKIGESAFEDCTNLKEVVVWGDNVLFGANAFANCPKLEEMPEGAYNEYSQEEVESDDCLEITQEVSQNKINAKDIKPYVEALLEKDLSESVKIEKLYFNEELQGAYVVFKSGNDSNAAGIRLETEKIDYRSEFEYYSEKAKELRAENPINETELHKCNQIILESAYSEWSFIISSMEMNDETSKNGWEKIK